MSEHWWEKDSDGDGVPDVIEEARTIKKRFGVKNILITMMIGLIVAGYGIGAFFYMDMRDDYITLQQQYDWQTTENEIEINAALIEERQKILKDLSKQAEDLQEDIAKSKALRKEAEHEVIAKPYARRNENEASKMDSNELIRGFNDLGFPPKSNGGG